MLLVIKRSAKDIRAMVRMLRKERNPFLRLSPHKDDWLLTRSMCVQILSALADNRIKSFPAESDIDIVAFKEYSVKVSKRTKFYYKHYARDDMLWALADWLKATSTDKGFLHGIDWKIDPQGKTLIENPNKWILLARLFRREK